MIDAVNYNTPREKLHWALRLWDQQCRSVIDHYGMQRVFQLMDQVEENGFMDGPSEDELIELNLKKKELPKPPEERADEVFRYHDNNIDGTVAIDLIRETPLKVISAY